jgi:hypothetical protein
VNSTINFRGSAATRDGRWLTINSSLPPHPRLLLRRLDVLVDALERLPTQRRPKPPSRLSKNSAGQLPAFVFRRSPVIGKGPVYPVHSGRDVRIITGLPSSRNSSETESARLRLRSVEVKLSSAPFVSGIFGDDEFFCNGE